jgi:hypothetical protein
MRVSPCGSLNTKHKRQINLNRKSTSASLKILKIRQATPRPARYQILSSESVQKPAAWLCFSAPFSSSDDAVVDRPMTETKSVCGSNQHLAELILIITTFDRVDALLRMSTTMQRGGSWIVKRSR